MSINYKFKNDKGSIGLGATNFLTPRSFLDFEVDTSLVTQNSTRELQLLNFKINFSYRIGKLTQKPSKKLKRVSNDDLKEGGDNNDSGGRGRGGN